ncbi:MAG: PqqD family protein [Lachnospiraceae bacterium]|nr:PqqD family protein [Lachnospiraceae bacterium]
MKDRFQLRYAAGRYWLLDMKQEGLAFRRPVCLNEPGALIWRKLCEGRTREEIADELCGRFGLERQEALEDCGLFIGQLQKQGILAEEEG